MFTGELMESIHKNLIFRIKTFPFIKAAFVISFLYWIYIGFVSQIIIAHDAIGYEKGGKIFFEEGARGYLKGGPQREFFYTFLIAASMHIAEYFSVSYHTIIKIIQISFLFFTQVLALNILKKLKIKPFLCALAVGYIGLSPGLINSALSLYSEIATYPFVLLTVILGAKAWLNIFADTKNVAITSMMLGLSLIWLTLVKGVFLLLSGIFLLPFFVLMIRAYMKNQKKIAKRSLVFLLIFLISFCAPFFMYKFANKKYNGNFAYSDRGPRILYGSTLQRLKVEDLHDVAVLISNVPGPRICSQFFNDADCNYWDFSGADMMAINKIADLSGKENSSFDQVNRSLLWLTIREIVSHPFKYTLTTLIHGLHLFFFESPKLGFVGYPDWMDNLFWNPVFENSLCFSAAILALAGFIFLMRRNWRNRAGIFDVKNKPDDQSVYLFFIFVVLFAFISVSSLFWFLSRYALPIAALHIINITFLFHHFLGKKGSNSVEN